MSCILPVGFSQTSGPSTFILPPPPPAISVWDGTSVGQRWSDLWTKPDRELGDLVLFPSGEVWRYSVLAHPGTASQGIWLPWRISVASPTVRCWFDETTADFDQLEDQGFTDVVSVGGGTLDFTGSGVELVANGGVESRVELGSDNVAFASGSTYVMGLYEKTEDSTAVANGHVLAARLSTYDVRLFAQGNSAANSSHIRYTTQNNALTANLTVTQVNPRLNPAAGQVSQFSCLFTSDNISSRLNQDVLWCRTAITGGSGEQLFTEVNNPGRVFLSSEKPNVVDQETSVRFYKWYALTY